MSDVLRPDPATSSDRPPLPSVPVFDTDPAIVDHVAQILGPSINRLFSVTLALTGMATAQTDTRAANRLFGAVHEIDDAIRQLREDLTAELVAARTACDGEHASW